MANLGDHRAGICTDKPSEPTVSIDFHSEEWEKFHSEAGKFHSEAG